MATRTRNDRSDARVLHRARHVAVPPGMGPGLGIEAAPPVVDLRHLTRHAGHSIGASGFEWLSKRLSETLSAGAYTAPNRKPRA
jgi:hypothetical protein